jgi:transposase
MSTKGKPNRRTFKEEFKRDAVNLVVVEGYSYAAAAKAVNVNYNTFRKWCDKYAPQPEACGPEASVEQLQSEVKLLRKQLRQAELEREILKKATAYFAKESQ